MNKLMYNKLALVCAVLPLALLMAQGVMAADIQKCQDAEGKWHYGDFADAACGNSVIDALDESGTKVGQQAPPPTEAELLEKEAMAKAIEEQKTFSEDQRRHDLEVVRIYGSEETIIATRDRKLESIDNNIEVTRQIKQGTLKDIAKLNEIKKTKKVERQLLERENAVKSYNRVIRHNLTERERLSEKYITILSDYRDSYGRIYGQ